MRCNSYLSGELTESPAAPLLKEFTPGFWKPPAKLAIIKCDRSSDDRVITHSTERGDLILRGKSAGWI